MERNLRKRAGVRGAAGFTLYELVVVIVVLALMAGVLIPMSGEDASYRLRLVEVQVRDALHHARAQAEATGTAHGVVFDAPGLQFVVVDGDGLPVTDRLTQGPYLIALDRPGQPKGVSVGAADFGADGNAAIFGPDGLPLRGGTVTLRCKSETLTVALDRVTGKVVAY